MEFIDILIGLFLLYEIVRGLKRGFMTEAASIVGIVVAFYAATAFREPMAQLLRPVCFESERWGSVIGFLFTFLVIYLLIIILAKVFEGILGVFALGGINRLAGGAFCFLKGALILSIILNLYETIDSDHSSVEAKHIESSIFYKPVLKVAPTIFPLFNFDKSYHQSKKPDSKDSRKITL